MSPALLNSLSLNVRSMLALTVTGRRASRGPFALALLLTLCLAVYVPGLASIAPVDRDECRFAQASRQMLESVTLPTSERDVRTDPATGAPVGRHAGGLVVPMVQTTPRLNKPPLVYWLQAASAYVFTLGNPSRDAMWMYRLPSALCACITVLLTWRLGLRLLDPRAALLGAALLAVSPIIVWDAHQARADQLLLATTTFTMYALWRCLHAHEAAASRVPGRLTRLSPTLIWPILLWLALGLGVLAKGFITPMVMLGCVLALCAARRSLGPLNATRPWLALIVLPLVLAPWIAAIADRFGLASYAQLVWNETFVRAAAGSKEGHFAPPGTHLVMLAALFWPGSLLTLKALAWAVRASWRDRLAPMALQPASTSSTPNTSSTSNPIARLLARARLLLTTPATGRAPIIFLLAWIVPSWLVFELSLAKLPHYTMPLYPPIALLSARVVLALDARKGPPDKAGTLIWLLIGLAAGLGAVIASALAPMDLATTTVIASILIVALAGPLLLLAARSAMGSHWLRAQWQGVLAAAIALPLSMQFLAPRVAPGATTAAVVRTLTAIDPAGARPLASTYREDSMVFSTRGRVERIEPRDAAAWLATNPAGLLVTGNPGDAPPAARVTPITGISRRLWVIDAR